MATHAYDFQPSAAFLEPIRRSELSDHLLDLETMLFDPSVRRDSATVAQLLTDDFREFGSSGKIYTKLDILAELSTEQPAMITLSDFTCDLVSPSVALVTYKSFATLDSRSGSQALRSSVWVLKPGENRYGVPREGTWQMQVPPGDAYLDNVALLGFPLSPGDGAEAFKRRCKRYAACVALASITGISGSPGWFLPMDASAHGAALDRHLLLNLWIAGGLLALVHLVLLVGLLARRRGPGARPARAAEILPLGFLVLLFVGLTIQAEILWAAARYTGPDPAALQVEVTGMQFAWYFRYPGEDARFGRTDAKLISPAEGNPVGIDPGDEAGRDDFVSAELVLPAGRPVDLRLHAVDVIHGFAVPEMRLKQNAVPGQTVHLHFTPTTVGTYAILCTQLCGSGHYRMQANLRVVPPAEYARWLAAKRNEAGR